MALLQGAVIAYDYGLKKEWEALCKRHEQIWIDGAVTYDRSLTTGNFCTGICLSAFTGRFVYSEVEYVEDGNKPAKIVTVISVRDKGDRRCIGEMDANNPSTAAEDFLNLPAKGYRQAVP